MNPFYRFNTDVYRVVRCNLLLLPCIYQSQNRAFIVVKAEPRIDVVVAHVREYAVVFLVVDHVVDVVKHLFTVAAYQSVGRVRCKKDGRNFTIS